MSSMRLLRTPAPYSGESFLGYLLRLTEENAYDSLRWIPQRVGLRVNLAQGRSLDTLSTGPKTSLRFFRKAIGSHEAQEKIPQKLSPGVGRDHLRVWLDKGANRTRCSERAARVEVAFEPTPLLAILEEAS